MDEWRLAILSSFNIFIHIWQEDRIVIIQEFMKRRKGAKRISPTAGTEPATSRFEIGSVNRLAMQTLPSHTANLTNIHTHQE